jgi:hypothetical protein
MDETTKKQGIRGPDGRLLPGHTLNPAGRPPGAVSKFTADLRDIFLQSLSEKGGVAWLNDFADKYPDKYFDGICKLLPRTVAISASNMVLTLDDIRDLRQRATQAQGKDNKGQSETIIDVECVANDTGAGSSNSADANSNDNNVI